LWEASGAEPTTNALLEKGLAFFFEKKEELVRHPKVLWDRKHNPVGPAKKNSGEWVVGSNE